MKLHKLFINAILAMLLSFNWLMAWADKKTITIAGSSGVASTAGGVTLWQLFRNYRGHIEIEVEIKSNGEIANINASDPYRFLAALKNMRFSKSLIAAIKKRINNDVTEYTTNTKETKFKFFINKKGDDVTIRGEVDGEAIIEDPLTFYKSEMQFISNNNPGEDITPTVKDFNFIEAAGSKNFITAETASETSEIFGDL